MYPDRELNRLAVHKAALQRGIALRRVQCVGAALRLAQPLELLDRMQRLSRQLSLLASVAAVRLGFLILRTVFPRLKALGALLRWAPLVFGAVRVIHSLTGTRQPPISAGTRSV